MCMTRLLWEVMGVKACYDGDDYSPVCREEVDALARRLRLKLFRTSVKENFNVEQGGWG